MFNGWVITRDHTEPAGHPQNRTGYGQMGNPAAHVKRGLRSTEVNHPLAFRMTDGDGEVYYSGVISSTWIHEHDEMYAFAPLRFGEADAGCTELEYLEGGRWVGL